MRLKVSTNVTITPDVALHISVYDEPSAKGGVRAHIITMSPSTRGPEVWVDAPELETIRDFLTAALEPKP